MARSLEDQLATAIEGKGQRTGDLEALLTRTKAERDAQTAAMEQAQADSLNLRLGEEGREAAAAKADRARRTVLALGTAIEALADKLTARRADDAYQAVEADRAEIIAERDALAERLRMEWPGLERRALELLAAISASDERMRRARIYDASAEALARGCGANFRNGPSQVRRLVEIALPSFTDGARLAWPMEADRAVVVEMAKEYVRGKDRELAKHAAAMASWQPWRITATAKCAFWTAISAKDSAEQEHPRDHNLYNHRPADQFGEQERESVVLWIRAETAAWLECSGFKVEPVAEVEAVA